MKLLVNDITIRDIFQSTDPSYINMDTIDRILGYYQDLNYDSLEVFGGSTFEKMLQNRIYKTPFQICRYIKNRIPNIPLQVLVGARNLMGLEIYSKNIIDKFVTQCMDCGISIFRVYDPLNDIDDIKYILKTIKENGGQCQGTIIYDNLKQYSFFREKALALEELGCKSICIKDVESTLIPAEARKLFPEISKNVNIPVFLSSSNIRGLQALNYYEACSGGCRGIDLSLIPSSYNDYNPTVFPILLSLNNTGINHNLNYPKIVELYEYIKKYIYPHLEQELFSSKYILDSQSESLLPKWLISSINRQLKEVGEIENIDAVLEEILRIKKELGNPSLSTPIGQIIGSQAILNTVISEQRWEITSDEINKFLAGYYGKPPENIDKAIKENFINENKEIAKIDEVPDIYGQCKEELKDLTGKQEDILSYCFFPEKTRKFLEAKKEPKTAAEEPADRKEKISTHNLERINLKKLREITNLVETSNIGEISLEIEGVKISVNKSKPAKAMEEKEPEAVPEKENGQENLVEIKSPIVGTFYNSPSPDTPPFVKEGDLVKKGDTLCIIEAMKLMNKINSDFSGEIH
ncbi:MAG: biotin/lipoyl-containing protein, partial [Candidatus Humimicrobiaceae bacterium]